jgi:hypothetical protein
MPTRNDERMMKIEDLQPSQHIVLKSELEKASKSQDLPEIWNVEGILVIADGHHKIYHAHQNGIKKIKVLYHSTKDKLIEGVYQYITEEMRREAEACREAGFFSISNLIVQ